MLNYIELGRAEGAELVAGGGTGGGDGYFVEPTLFTSERDDLRIAREEIFGPVLLALPYETLEEVAAGPTTPSTGSLPASGPAMSPMLTGWPRSSRRARYT